MRDNQAYRLVGPYDTFEDYCKDVEGLAYTTAQYKIKAYLVHSAIEQNLGPTKVGPSIESQVRQFFEHENAIARFKTEKRIVEDLNPSQSVTIYPHIGFNTSIDLQPKDNRSHEHSIHDRRIQRR